MIEFNITSSPHDVLLVDRDWETGLADELRRRGRRIFTVEGGPSVESFCQALKEAVPMDPPISGSVNWNAISDSLFGGMDALGAASAAILWKDADWLLELDRASFSTILDILSDVVDTLRQERKMGRTEASLQCFGLGKGPRFVPLDLNALIGDES